MGHKKHKLLTELASVTPEDLAHIEAELANLREQLERLERVRDLLKAWGLGIPPATPTHTPTTKEGSSEKKARSRDPDPNPPPSPPSPDQGNGKKEEVVKGRPLMEVLHEDEEEIREERLSVVIYLHNEGAQPAGMIRQGCHLPKEGFDRLMDCDWFTQGDAVGTWNLTSSGRGVARREVMVQGGGG